MLHRVPDLSDTNYMLQILMYLGADVERASGTVTVRAEKVESVAPYEVVRKMRASVCVLGPLLARCREATVSLPGGCVIGDRPIDLHLKGFEALGAAVRVEGGNVRMFTNQLKGAVINLRGKFGPTVLGTDNVMMAAVLAEGTTVIEGAASEPEVVDLANFLNKMGAKIEGAGTRRLIIEGVKELHGAEHDIIPDRIEAGTFLVAGAVCGKGVTVNRVNPEHVSARHHCFDRGRLQDRDERRLDHRRAEWRLEAVGIGHAAVSRFSHRYAGANVRAPCHHGRHQRDDGEYFSAALHAPRGAETDGRAGADRGTDRGHPRRGKTLRRAGDGERSARLGGFGFGGLESGRRDGNQPRLSHRPRLRASRRKAGMRSARTSSA